MLCLCHKPITTLQQLLTNVKDNDEPNDRQGAVYKIKCCDCQATYIGETGRNLNTRLTEHKRATRNGDLNNNIAEHHLQTNHRINWDSGECVIYSTDNITMTLKMTTAQVAETSVTVTNSSFQNYTHPDDHTRQTTDTPGFKPFTILLFITIISYSVFFMLLLFCPERRILANFEAHFLQFKLRSCFMHMLRTCLFTDTHSLFHALRCRR